MATFAVATTYSPSSVSPLKPRRFGFHFASFLSSTTKLKCPSITTTTTTTLAVATHPTVSVNPNSDSNSNSNSNSNHVVLPSNESSERLLRVRHTVIGKPILWLLNNFVSLVSLTSFRHAVYRNINCIYFQVIEYKLQSLYIQFHMQQTYNNELT